jgi:mono/diheme cytochrome c family protein
MAAYSVNLTKHDLTYPSYVFQAIADGRERGSMRMPAARDTLFDEEIWQTTALCYVLWSVWGKKLSEFASTLLLGGQ